MKTQNYCNLEQEIKQKVDKTKYKSWRGDLSKKGLDKVVWNDLECIQSEVNDIKETIQPIRKETK